MFSTFFSKKTHQPNLQDKIKVYISSSISLKDICETELKKDSKSSGNEGILRSLNVLYKSVTLIEQTYSNSVKQNEVLLQENTMNKEIVFLGMGPSKELEDKIRNYQIIKINIVETALSTLYAETKKTVENILKDQMHPLLKKLNKIADKINQIVPGICYSSCVNNKHKRSSASLIEPATSQEGIVTITRVSIIS